MNKRIRFLAFAAACVALGLTSLPTISAAQSLPNETPDEIPINGGLGLLALGGGAYAMRKLKKKRLSDSNE